MTSHKKPERTNQLTTAAADEDGIQTPQAPTRDPNEPSKEQLLRGVLNLEAVRELPTPEEWREGDGG